MELFRAENMTGYTPHELDLLNAEWETHAATQGMAEFTEEYDAAAKAFSDEVSRR